MRSVTVAPEAHQSTSGEKDKRIGQNITYNSNPTGSLFMHSNVVSLPILKSITSPTDVWVSTVNLKSKTVAYYFTYSSLPLVYE
jgi:hypothetical protein